MIPARAAAMLLLLVWAGPVTFVQGESFRVLRWLGAPAPASAESQVIPAGQALVLAPKTLLKFHLRDGRVIEARFVERVLLDSADYAPRFAEHVRSSAFVPLALQETLRVALLDGREWTAPFAGYAELTLLLRSPDGPGFMRVPFEFARSIQRGNGESVEPGDLARAFRAGLLPSAEALSVQERPSREGFGARWGKPRALATDDIATVTTETAPDQSSAGVIVLAVVASVLAVLLLVNMAADKNDGGCEASGPPPTFLSGSGFQLTTRPFDRSRGCYVGDPPLAAGAWPGAAVVGPSATLATSTTPAAPAP